MVFFTFQGNVIAELIYSENFGTDPSFTFSDSAPHSADSYIWNSSDAVYEIKLREEHNVYKYALTPEFSRVENTSFVVEVDLKPVRISFGQGMRIVFYDTNSGYDGVYSLYFQQGGTTNANFRISGDGMDKQQTTNTTMGTWYRIKFSYNHDTGLANILITERDTGNIFYQNNEIPFTPLSFNRCAIGDHTYYTDGYEAEMHYDNISVRNGGTAVLSVDPSSVNLVVSQTTTCTFSGGTGIYGVRSENTSVATVALNGSAFTVTGVSTGSATITYFDSGGDWGTLPVSVGGSGGGLSVDPSSVNLSVGETKSCAISGGTGYYRVYWSETSVAEVSLSGSTLYVHGLAKGSATISVFDNYGNSASVSVSVSEVQPAW